MKAGARWRLCFAERTMVFPQPLLQARQPIAAAGGFPFADQDHEFAAQGELAQGILRAIQTAVGLVPDRVFKILHPSTQDADLAPDFINSVVHGPLEQNENI
ncbi:hypothetical protein [Bradyrhizobium sp.]|uniref:hypothetical protein n=1 Tax=Bradyrhizobium sp. TaxID=376 RepID=UPI003C7331EC